MGGTGKVCTLWDRGGGSSGGENKGATGPAEKRVSAGVEQRNSPSEERGRASSREWSTPDTLAGVRASRHQSQGSNEIRPAQDPSLASPFGLSLLVNPAFMGMVGVHPPAPPFLGRGDRVARAFRQWRQKVPPSQSASSGRGAVAPIFQKLTIEAPKKQPLPPPILQRLAGSGDPSALGNESRPRGDRPELPSSRSPRKGWRAHGCKVLGFFSLLDMNKGIRTASFRRSLRRTKGPAVRAAQPLIKQTEPCHSAPT